MQATPNEEEECICVHCEGLVGWKGGRANELEADGDGAIYYGIA